ncbi:MAG TPA: methylated-DNA--[protein]-cysteine S-methyltransferase [Puia sp.]|nr:methylated-DNA--[protein]-cysteine S-methyltransferase [Puia sp.]
MYDYYRVAQALKYIKDNMQEQPKLEDVARNIHVSPFHFQRLFTDWAGISPKKFLQYISVEHAKQILRQNGNSVYDAAYETGLSGTGRLHDLFVNIEGMTPGEYKNGGQNLSIQYSLNECQFGNYIIASTPKGICNLLFFEKSARSALDELKGLWPNAKIFEETNPLHQSVQNFFNDDFTQADKIKLYLRGTPFQIKVWETLLRIPEAHLSSYSNIANAIGRPGSQRSVGTAIGNNPVGFIIPCHRVIKNLGDIGEYRWGAERKMAMIGWEAAKMETA